MTVYFSSQEINENLLVLLANDAEIVLQGSITHFGTRLLVDALHVIRDILLAVGEKVPQGELVSEMFHLELAIRTLDSLLESTEEEREGKTVTDEDIVQIFHQIPEMEEKEILADLMLFTYSCLSQAYRSIVRNQDPFRVAHFLAKAIELALRLTIIPDSPNYVSSAFLYISALSSEEPSRETREKKLKDMEDNLRRKLEQSEREELEKISNRRLGKTQQERCSLFTKKCKYQPLDMEDWCEHDERYYYGPTEDKNACFDLREILEHFETCLNTEMNGNKYPQYPYDPFDRSKFPLEELQYIYNLATESSINVAKKAPKFKKFKKFLETRTPEERAKMLKEKETGFDYDTRVELIENYFRSLL
jgi:hypothetical protein